MKIFNRHKLRKLRLSKGYSLQMMARLITIRSDKKLSRSAISHWEQGKTQPSLESLLAVCELFNMPMESFFARETNYLFDEDEQTNCREGA